MSWIWTCFHTIAIYWFRPSSSLRRTWYFVQSDFILTLSFCSVFSIFNYCFATMKSARCICLMIKFRLWHLGTLCLYLLNLTPSCFMTSLLNSYCISTSTGFIGVLLKCLTDGYLHHWKLSVSFLWDDLCFVEISVISGPYSVLASTGKAPVRD